jgi:hypothetical protein
MARYVHANEKQIRVRATFSGIVAWRARKNQTTNMRIVANPSNAISPDEGLANFPAHLEPLLDSQAATQA